MGCKRKNGALFLFCEKPKKSKSYWINSNTFNSLVLPKEAFPSVKWEDIVTNKYIRNSDTYVLELMNPFSKKTKEVYVRDYLYYNTYFVGDTIK